jgi:Dolichyl-phosphate-mannose-protein mannosyltransferase
LNFGHVLLTATPDLVIWPMIAWLVIRAELHQRPALWLVAGAVAGVATYQKLLVAVLLVGIGVGLALTAPRRLASREVLGAGVVALVLALPNVVFQVTHGWPQLAMGRALSENNAGEVRWFMWVFLLIVLGLPLVYVWLRGLVALWRRPEWQPVRFLVPAFVVVLVFTFVGGSQPYYPTFLLLVVFAAGVVVCGEALWQPAWGGLLAVNWAVSVVVSLPVLPVSVVGNTPIPGMNLLVADSIGWDTYTDQIAAVAADEPGSVVVTANYGEAGAVAHFTDLSVYSGHNALADQARPPDGTRSVIYVGELDDVDGLFGSCQTRDTLDNGLGVANEEQGIPVSVCRDPVAPWATLWPEFAHLD